MRFPGEVADLLSQSGLAQEVLRLEITEDTIMVDPERVLDTIARLGELGLSFALDDFGTGYSSPLPQAPPAARAQDRPLVS